MRTPQTPDTAGWFGLRRRWVLSVARPLGPLLSVVVILLFALAVTAAGAILLHAIFDLGPGTPRTGFGTGAVIVALLGAPFVIWRAVVAQREADIAQEGQITDRINTSVQGLGAEKVVKRNGEEYTQPNLEVRIGAIYALERIAQDSDRDMCRSWKSSAPISGRTRQLPKPMTGPNWR